MPLVDHTTQLFNEGQRSVICYILGLADADAGAIKQAFQESADHAENIENDLDDLGV